MSEKKLEISQVQLNDIYTENCILRDQVDFLRKDIINRRQVIIDLDKNIDKYSNLVKVKNKEIVRVEAETGKGQLHLLRSKSATVRHRFNVKIEELGQVLQHDKTQQSATVKLIKDSFNAQLFRPLDVLDNSKVVEVLIKICLKRIKSKEKQISDFQENLKATQDLFEEIKEKSEYKQTDEITKVFILNEEKNASILRYLNGVNIEIDDLKKSLLMIEENIENFETQNYKNEDAAYLLTQDLDKKIKESASINLSLKDQSNLLIRNMVGLYTFFNVNLT